MLTNRGTQSKHYFHSIALENRINVSQLSDAPVDMSAFTPEQIAPTIVPSASDDKAIRENMATLISRVLSSHMKFFNFSFSDVVDWHIQQLNMALFINLGMLLTEQM